MTTPFRKRYLNNLYILLCLPPKRKEKFAFGETNAPPGIPKALKNLLALIVYTSLSSPDATAK